MRAFACACAIFLAASAWAQVELVDPDAPAVRAKKNTNAPPPKRVEPADEGVDEVDPGSDETNEDAPPAATPPKAVFDAGAPFKDVKKPLQLKKETRPAANPLAVTPMSDSQLDQAWAAWREASASNDVKREQDARQELLHVKRRIGASNLEGWAGGLLRASSAREAAGDSGAAVEMALSAVELAPDLPSAWTGLAVAYARADPTDVGRYVTALKNAFVLQLDDPRYSRPMLADFLTVLLMAFIGTATAVVLVLLLKRGLYFLYDFHFLFPRAAARWQTAALAVILLFLPIVFRLGLVPVLLVFFFALTLYLSVAERLVAAVLIASLGFVPEAGGAIAKATSFAGTPAEKLYALERGGSNTEGLASEFSTLAAEDKASFAELAALGRYEIRRGKLEASIGHLKKALAMQPADVAARVNLGVALMLTGDLENPKDLFGNAKADAPAEAAPAYDLGRLYQRRYQTYGERAAGDADNATGEFFEAHRRDPRIDTRPDDVKYAAGDVIEGNEYLMTMPLSSAALNDLAVPGDAPRRVTSQLTQMILGAPEGIAPYYPAALALLIAGLGFLAKSIDAARSCAKCGRPVSRRGDPDVSPGSLMCTQCVNVFAKKNIVATQQKVLKQLEVARYQSRMERMSYVLGLLFSGMGHVFAGWPIRGALYGFLFLAALIGFLMRNGLLRAPYEPLPVVLRMVPLVALFIAVYALSLRELRKKRG